MPRPSRVRLGAAGFFLLDLVRRACPGEARGEPGSPMLVSNPGHRHCGVMVSPGPEPETAIEA